MVSLHHVFGSSKSRDWLTEPRESAPAEATRLMARKPEKPSQVPGTCKETGAFLYTLIRATAWTEQQCRNFVSALADRGEPISYLIRDGDTKFTDKFDAIIKSEGGNVKKLPPESPNLNAFAER